MRRERFTTTAAWLCAICFFGFALLVIAPGRGAGWLVDDGLFLANAWNVIHGFGLDGMLPQEPVYLVNALFMKLGLTEILHQRYAFYCLSALSAWIFFSGLEDRRAKSWVVPVAIVGTLCIAFSSILLMAGFFSAAAGCYFHASQASGRRRNWLMITSGVFFALAAFMHAALAIAMLLVLVLIYILDRSVRHSFLAPVFVTLSVLLWGCYLHALGLERFFTTPSGHEYQVEHLFINVIKILWFFVSSLVAFYVCARLFKRHGTRRYKWSQYCLSILVTLVYSIKFFAGQLISVFPNFFVTLFGWVGFVRYPADRLIDAPRWTVDVPGAIFYLLLFIFFRLVAETYSRTITELAVSHPFSRIWRSFQACFATPIHQRLLIAVAGLCLSVAGYAAGSASSFAICLSIFCGPVLGVLLIAWSHMEPGNLKSLPSLLIAVWCAIFLLFATTMNQPTFAPIVPDGNRVILKESPLTGIKETVRYQMAVEQLKIAYAAGGCSGKRLILLDYVPTVYLILQHEVPNTYGVVRPSVYFPDDKIKDELDKPVGWCVLDVTTDETRTIMRRAQGTPDRRSAVRSLVQVRSHQAITLPSPSKDVEPMTLYIN